MRTRLFSAALFIGTASLSIDSSPDALAGNLDGHRPIAVDTMIQRVKLADDIYLFRSPSGREHWTGTNTVVVVNDADITVFDSNTRPSTTRLIVAEIRKLSPKPVRYLINSHWHMDHWSGNEVYAKEYPGVQIIATTESRDFMKRFPPKFFSQSINLPRLQARLDTLIKTGKKTDGTPFTADDRRVEEAELADIRIFAAEMATVTHVLPTLAYHDSMTFWSGRREFRLMSVTGDASGSTVLYLPAERLLVTGDVLVRQEDGTGAQPWTLNSYDVTPWLASLRFLSTLDVAVTVPGQGPELRDGEYLRLTIEMFDSIIAQVHAALENGATTLAEVRQAVKLDSIRSRFTKDQPDSDLAFKQVTDGLIGKAFQEAHDGVAGR